MGTHEKYKALFSEIEAALEECHPCNARALGLKAVRAAATAVAELSHFQDKREAEKNVEAAAAFRRLLERQGKPLAYPAKTTAMPESTEPRTWKRGDPEPVGVECVMNRDQDLWWYTKGGWVVGNTGRPSESVEEVWKWHNLLNNYGGLTEMNYPFLVWESEGGDQPPPDPTVKWLLDRNNQVTYTRIGTGDKWRSSEWDDADAKTGYWTFFDIFGEDGPENLMAVPEGPTYKLLHFDEQDDEIDEQFTSLEDPFGHYWTRVDATDKWEFFGPLKAHKRLYNGRDRVTWDELKHLAGFFLEVVD